MKNQPAVYPSHFVPANRRLRLSEAGVQGFVTTLGEQAVLEDFFIKPLSRYSLPPATGFQLLLPVVGSVELHIASSPTRVIESGQLYVRSTDAAELILVNPFPEDTINVLMIQLPQLPEAFTTLQGQLLPISIVEKNVLTGIQAAPNFIRVGVYDTRRDAFMVPNTDATGIFVLNGSFEVDGRLLEYRDALLLRERTPFEYEALAELSILLILSL